MKILSVVGARPQFVKASMIHVAIEHYNGRRRGSEKLQHCVVHTGQHYERNLSDVFFAELPLPKPDYYLDVRSGSHGAQTAAMLERIETVLVQEKPHVAVVYGDTNSSVAGALAAAKIHIPVAHVEAGLRSFNRDMPEELNRVMADHLSDLLFCPTPTAIENLKNEGITHGVVYVGDVMLDAVRAFLPFAARRTDLLGKLGVHPRGFILATIHRAENTDSPENLAVLIKALVRLDRPVVFPMHPRLRDRLSRPGKSEALKKSMQQASHLRITDPLSYLDMLMLETNARIVMTDSGGVQKEAYFLGVPCITLRGETEWVETLRGGRNQLAGISLPRILRSVESLWSGNGTHPRGCPQLKAFGRGDAAERIVGALANRK